MSHSRTRFSPPPRRANNEFETPRSAWSQQPNDTGIGLSPSEIWGVSSGPSNRHRGEKARARRRAKQAAKRKGLTLKAYLRKAQVKS